MLGTNNNIKLAYLARSAFIYNDLGLKGVKKILSINKKNIIYSWRLKKSFYNSFNFLNKLNKQKFYCLRYFIEYINSLFKFNTFNPLFNNFLDKLLSFRAICYRNKYIIKIKLFTLIFLLLFQRRGSLSSSLYINNI